MAHRIERVNQQIRREVSELLIRHIKDPRLSSFISVTEVSATNDLRHAIVFISFLGSDEEKQTAIKTLNTASGYFHNELGRRLKMRRVPELSFKWDDSIERGSRIMDIIDRISHESGSDHISQAL
ncbi:MAG: 30S ribosome-binding factor RbfA [Dehalococcoidales bacterium]|jgi:ribosome-binding factor A